MAAKLGELGMSYRVLTADGGVGGTWWRNTYPGVGVDVPSLIYSFSFEQNPDWSRMYPSGEECWRYAEDFARKYGVTEHVQFNTVVKSAEFDETHSVWRTLIDGGQVLVSKYFFGAWGAFPEPKVPDIPGLNDFAGEVVHTARWPEGLEMSGRRVGVIGTGASAVQVVPSIAGMVKHLSVFQRTATWVLPRPDFDLPCGLRWAFRRIPGVQRLVRYMVAGPAEAILVVPIVRGGVQWWVRTLEHVGRWWIRRQVADPAVQRKLTPHYGFGCKRPTFSNTYLPAYNRENVDLVTAPIERITSTGIRTTDGVEHECDTLVLATGFSLYQAGKTPPLQLRGRSGTELGELWESKRYKAYHAVSIPDFPNLFLPGWGPYGLAGPSFCFMIEINIHHIVRCLEEVRRRGADEVEVRDEAHEAYFDYILEKGRRAPVLVDDCHSSNTYYLDPHGDAPAFRPLSSVTMWRLARTFPLSDYAFTSMPKLLPAASSATT
ncbi:flavin-containing monooxygenase [Mycolicibacterium peregrinum]